MKTTIFAFGDSITHGEFDLELGGWANRLHLRLIAEEIKHDNWDINFYNLGIPGETTEGLINRFENETRVRVRNGFENIFIFAFGANDAAFLPGKNTPEVPVEKFAKNLESTILSAQKYSSKIIILNITPVVEKFTASSHEKKYRTNEFYKAYNQKIEELAIQYKLSLVDVNSAFMQHGHESLLPEDGLHPNAEGHKIMSELVLETIQKLK